MTIAPLLTRLHEKARPPVLAPAPLALVGTLWPLFSIAQDGNAARVDPLCDEKIHCGLRPPFPEINVDLILSTRGPPIVGVPLDQYEVAWMRAQPCRVRLQDLHVARPDRRPAEVEVNVPQIRDRLVVSDRWQADGLLSNGRGTYRGCLRQDQWWAR